MKRSGAAKRTFVRLAIFLLPLLGQGATQAQVLLRSPAERQELLQLSYILGEVHALHRLCAGDSDGLWYERMQALEAEERTDEGFRRRLVESFNAGFLSCQGQFAVCSLQSRSAEQAAASKGAVLAARLARSGH